MPFLHLSKKSLLKWSAITVFCGSNSFFLGYSVTQGAILPMVLGLITLIFLFTLTEASPRYQALRTANSSFRVAVNWGIITRCFWSIVVFFPYVWAGGEGSSVETHSSLILFPTWTNALIGMLAIGITKIFTGVDISLVGQIPTSPDIPGAALMGHVTIPNSSFSYQFAVYLTTMITGLIHTTLLALLCATFYVGFVISAKLKQFVKTHHNS